MNNANRATASGAAEVLRSHFALADGDTLRIVSPCGIAINITALEGERGTLRITGLSSANEVHQEDDDTLYLHFF